MNGLLIPTLIVIIFWIAILLLFLAISRKQPDVQGQMKNLEDQLDKSEKEGK